MQKKKNKKAETKKKNKEEIKIKDVNKAATIQDKKLEVAIKQMLLPILNDNFIFI